MFAQDVDFVNLPSGLDKKDILAKIREGFELALLEKGPAKDSAAIKRYKEKHPNWEYSYKLFLAWMDKDRNGRQGRFLLLLEKFPEMQSQ